MACRRSGVQFSLAPQSGSRSLLQEGPGFLAICCGLSSPSAQGRHSGIPSGESDAEVIRINSTSSGAACRRLQPAGAGAGSGGRCAAVHGAAGASDRISGGRWGSRRPWGPSRGFTRPSWRTCHGRPLAAVFAGAGEATRAVARRRDIRHSLPQPAACAGVRAYADVLWVCAPCAGPSRRSSEPRRASCAHATDPLAEPWQNRTAGGGRRSDGEESAMPASILDAVRGLPGSDNGGISYVCTACRRSWN